LTGSQKDENEVPARMRYPRRKPTGHTCPSCGSTFYTYRSRKRTWWEKLARFLGRHPYRCDPCGHRFMAFTNAKERADLRSQEN
jgi:predicted RNA-binding Zn-ribbon protein involved in translation (DUF1610 family)